MARASQFHGNRLLNIFYLMKANHKASKFLMGQNDHE